MLIWKLRFWRRGAEGSRDVASEERPARKTRGGARYAGWLVPAGIWWVIAAFLFFVAAYPTLTLLVNSFKTGDRYGFSNYVTVFRNSAILTSILNSMRVVIPSTLIATALGVFLAWVVTRTDLPLNRFWQTLLAIPYFIPPFIGAIAWTFLLGPVGYINRILMALFNLNAPPFDIYSIGGMIFVMSLYRYAIPFIIVMPTMKRISSAMEEAARISGASKLRTMLDITIPLLTPSIMGAMLLLFMFILADFGVSAVLGSPNQIRLMTTQIYYLVNRPDLPGNLQIASAYSILLSLFGLIGLLLYHRVLKTNRYVVVGGKSGSPEPTRLGWKRWLVFAVLVMVFLGSTCAPLLATLITALTKVFGLPFRPGNITLQNFVSLIHIPNISRAFRNSLFLSGTSALIIALVTMIVAYLAVRGGGRGIKGMGLMQTMVTLPYAVPGTIIALSMILSFAQPLPVIGVKLYGTIWILLIAYIARFMNLGYNNISGAISQIDPSLEEAARMSGATRMRSFVNIMFPLLRRSLYSSFFLVIAPTLSEITLSSMLWSVRNETIGTVVFSSQEEGKILRTAALAIVLIALVGLINLLLRWLSSDTQGPGRWQRDQKHKI